MSKTVKFGILSDTVNAICLKHCIMLACIDLYQRVPVLMSRALF